MLSILIPTYNYDVSSLVAELKRQCDEARIAYEILVADDASPVPAIQNQRINELENCAFDRLAQNIGRSKIRNLLGQRARFGWLLFLDSDTMPMGKDFIRNYISEFEHRPHAINGGIRYDSERPAKAKRLRWAYGKEREALAAEKRNENPYLAFLSLNFAMPKALFELAKFDESLPNLRHEDTVFSHQLKTLRIPVKHIENPVLHLGLDEFQDMLRKEHSALLALKLLVDSGKLPVDYVKMGNYYRRLNAYGLRRFIAFGFRLWKPLLIRNISGGSPSLFLYDLYRLGYLCSI